MTPATKSVHAGDTFTLDVVVNPQQFGLTAGDVTISFATAVFEVMDIQPGGLLGSDTIMGTRKMDNTAGTAQIAVGRVGAIPSSAIPTSQGTLAVITLKVRDGVSPRTSSVTITSVGLADQSFANVPGIVLKASSVSITP